MTIIARDLERQETVRFQATRVFVGAGVLPTAALTLNSLGAFDQSVEMLDSQYFIYPFFPSAKRTSRCGEGGVALSLAQAFVEIDDPAISRHLVHLEIFSYSDFLKRALIEPRPCAISCPLPVDRGADAGFGRLLVVQGFLHSRRFGQSQNHPAQATRRASHACMWRSSPADTRGGRAFARD